MMLGATLLGGQLLAGDSLLPRRVLVLCFVVVLGALALSFSRSAWVGTGAGLLYLGLFVDRRALAVLAVGLAIALLTPQIRDRLAGAVTVQDAASVMRVDEYRESARVIAEHPFIGVGFGPAYGLNLVRRVSNMYLLIAEETGLAGLASLLVLLGLVVWGPVRRQGASEVGRGVLGALRAALVACLVAGLFDHYFMNSLFPHTAGLFWFFAGLLLVAARLEKEVIEGQRRGGDSGPGEARGQRASRLA
jgi:O-antigen ligase